MSKPPSTSDVQSKMLDNRQIFLGSPISDECAEEVIAKLLYLQMSDAVAPTSLFINSPGGSITASLAILDTMNFLRPPVCTYGMSYTQGAALWVLAAGAPGHRYCQPDSELSIESTTMAAVDAKKVDHLKRLNERMAALLSTRSNLCESDILEYLRTGRSFSPVEAVAAGMVDAMFSMKT